MFMAASKRRENDNAPDQQDVPLKPVYRVKRHLTEREQTMFWKLKQACAPLSLEVFTQVSFGAMINATNVNRMKFGMKHADFVLCDRALKVVAVIELDDNSHRGNEARDHERDAMLEHAGYVVKRFAQVPNGDDLDALLAHLVGNSANKEPAKLVNSLPVLKENKS